MSLFTRLWRQAREPWKSNRCRIDRVCVCACVISCFQLPQLHGEILIINKKLMILTPRVYQQSQTQAGQELWSSIRSPFDQGLKDWYDLPLSTKRHVQKMLLVHQIGSVRIGEVVRCVVNPIAIAMS